VTRKDSGNVLGWILVGLLPAMILTVGFCISRAGEIRRENRRKLHIVRDRLADEVHRWVQDHRPGRSLAALAQRDAQARACLGEILLPPSQLGKDVRCLLVSREGPVLLPAGDKSGVDGGIEPARKQMGARSVDFTFESGSGRIIRASYRPIPGLDGGVLLCQDASAVNRTVHRMLYEALVLLGAVSAGLVGIVALWGGSARSIRRKSELALRADASRSSDYPVRLTGRAAKGKPAWPGVYIPQEDRIEQRQIRIREDRE
jgi:hypothetical protein